VHKDTDCRYGELTNLYALTDHRKCLCFEVVVERALSNDSSSADGSVLIGGAFSDRQVGVDDPDVKGYSGPARWVGRGAENQINTNILLRIF